MTSSELRASPLYHPPPTVLTPDIESTILYCTVMVSQSIKTSHNNGTVGQVSSLQKTVLFLFSYSRLSIELRLDFLGYMKLRNNWQLSKLDLV
jgi:hypothetical protein